MSKFEKIIIPVFMFLISSSALVKAQIPFNDPNSWQLQSNADGSEDFNSQPDYNSTGKWYSHYPLTNGYSIGAGELTYQTNLIWNTNDTTIKIKSDTLTHGVKIFPSKYGTDTVTYVYQGGVLWRRRNSSNVDHYKYGYIEINAKFPTSCYSLWVTFWLWMSDCGATTPYYNEIDIIENAAEIVYDGHKVTTNTWMYIPGTDPCSYDNTVTDYQEINTSFLLSSAFHKYAIEWEPDRISWYIDNIHVRTIYDATGINIPQNPMTVILSSGIHPGKAFLPANWNGTTYFGNPPVHGDSIPVCFDGIPSNPKYFEIDYLKYYKLISDNNNCASNQAICTPSDYNRAVKQSITTTNTCTINYNPSTVAGSYTLRATDAVTIDAPTLGNSVTINPTSVGYFAIQTMPCPQ